MLSMDRPTAAFTGSCPGRSSATGGLCRCPRWRRPDPAAALGAGVRPRRRRAAAPRDRRPRRAGRRSAFSSAQGLRLVARNFRCRMGELDLVMLDGRLLVVVEVRYRTRPDPVDPAVTVTATKRRRLLRAASRFLQAPARLPRSRPAVRRAGPVRPARGRRAATGSAALHHRRRGPADRRRSVPASRYHGHHDGPTTPSAASSPTASPSSRRPMDVAGARHRAGRRGHGRHATRRRQDPHLRQWRLGRRRPAFLGRAAQPVRARAPGPARGRADHGHLDADVDRQRLCLRAGVLEAGAGARPAGGLPAGDLHVRQLPQRRRGDSRRPREAA